MPLLLGNELGNERIYREALVILAGSLNAELSVQDAKWTTLDKDLAALLQIEYVACTSDKVQPQNFYPGHIPSLIMAPVSAYPNVSVMSDQVVPAPVFGSDHYNGARLPLIIESIVLDGPYTSDDDFHRNGEELVNKKVQRMAEAIHAVIGDNPTLNGLVMPIVDEPRVIFSECFRRSESTSYGADYYWQGVNMTYQVDKVVNHST